MDEGKEQRNSGARGERIFEQLLGRIDTSRAVQEVGRKKLKVREEGSVQVEATSQLLWKPENEKISHMRN